MYAGPEQCRSVDRSIYISGPYKKYSNGVSPSQKVLPLGVLLVRKYSRQVTDSKLENVAARCLSHSWKIFPLGDSPNKKILPLSGSINKFRSISILNLQEVFYFIFFLQFPSHYPTSCLVGCVDVTDVLSQEEYRFSHSFIYLFTLFIYFIYFTYVFIY